MHARLQSAPRLNCKAVVAADGCNGIQALGPLQRLAKIAADDFDASRVEETDFQINRLLCEDFHELSRLKSHAARSRRLLERYVDLRSGLEQRFVRLALRRVKAVRLCGTQRHHEQDDEPRHQL
jgi:hypothetical protein